MMNLFSLLAKPMGLLLQLLYNVVGHYWLAILLLSVGIRGVMYPLYKKQTLQSVDMAEFSRKSQELQKKYANDRDTLNAKMAELQRQEGFNPLSGCLPMLIQTIVLIGLFTVFRNPLNYVTDVDKMVFAVHESFLWIKDLSQPDPWILPILTGVATYFSFSMNDTSNAQASSANSMAGTMSVMKYVFPIMLVWLAHSYPAGLAIYWFISQGLQILFNLRFNKLRKELQAQREEERNKGKNKGKGK